MKLFAIVAMDEERGIGRDGQLPWHLSGDLKRFKKLTTGHTVLMGRKTYESFPDKVRPLPDRTNVVLTTRPDSFSRPDSVRVYTSIDECLGALRRDVDGVVWVLGGADLFRQLLPLCDEVHLTLVPGKHNADTFLPKFEDAFELVSSEETPECTYCTYRALDVRQAVIPTKSTKTTEPEN